MSADALTRVEGLCGSWVEQDVHKALCVLVARRGVVCLHEAFGRLGPRSGPPLEPDSIFPMMSLTKTITATALMMLVEEGLVGLTRPVQDYVPEFCGDAKESVLVHHLLTHTSGLADEDIDPKVREGWRSAQLPTPEPTQRPEIHKELLLGADVPLARKPGEEMVYANYNYALLGEIVRRTSGRSLDEFAEARIFRPLGMKDTSFVLAEELYPRTIDWRVGAGFLDSTTKAFRDSPHPSGGVHSTAMDMAFFGQMFLNGGSYGDARVLGRGTVAEMTRDQIPGIGATLGSLRFAEASWGYSWAIAGNQKWPGWPTFTKGTFMHSGAGSLLLWVDPTHEIVGIYLSICRYKAGVMEPVTNVDLFVNAITAAVED
jgi:CubicO group peptidase (beta-lactamase class C family)